VGEGGSAGGTRSAGHFVVFNYDGEHQIMVLVFDQTMCRQHYIATARGKAAVSSSEEEEDH
jgi:hypothetical protein